MTGLRGFLVLQILVSMAAVALSARSYQGYHVIRTKSLDENDLQKVLTKVLSRRDFQIWSEPRLNRPAELLIGPKKPAELLNYLLLLGLDPKPHIKNVEKTLRKERKFQRNVKRREDADGLNRNVTFERFMDLGEIYVYLNQVVQSFPEIASLEEIGQSYENRSQLVLKLSNGAAPGKIGIFVDAAIHAAEWQAPAVALHTIYQLTENMSTNQHFLDIADWYILPVANPDGYVYSWTEDRLWRKTRRPNEGSDCIGTDPNRNFDSHWGEGDENDPCLWNYPGSNVYSEIEAKNMADYLVSLKGKLHLYVAMHSFGSLLLHPYGYTLTEQPPNYDDLYSVANATVEALKSVRGTEYTYGSSGVTLYLAFGNTQDFAYDAAQVPFSYTWELPEGGPNGHDPPDTEIKSVVEECLAAYKELVQRVYDTVNQNQN